MLSELPTFFLSFFFDHGFFYFFPFLYKYKLNYAKGMKKMIADF